MTRIIRLNIPGQVFLFDWDFGDTKADDETLLEQFVAMMPKDGLMKIPDPMVVMERQAPICPACGEAFDGLEGNRCPNCHQEIVDAATGAPLLVGGKQIIMGKGLIAVPWTHSFELHPMIMASTQNAVVGIVKEDSNLKKMMEKGRLEAKLAEEAERVSKSGIVTATDIKTVDKMAKMTKQAQANLKGKGFSPKMI